MDETSRLQEATKQICLSNQEVEDPKVSHNLEQALESLQIGIKRLDDESDACQFLPEEKRQ